MTVKVILALVLAIALFAGGFYVGRLQPQLAAAKATIKRNAENTEQEQTDATRINLEAKQLAAAALDPIAAPVVRVLYGPPAACVPRTPASRPLPDAAPAVPAPGPANSLPGPDIGRPLVSVGHEADAQVAGLQDYITYVCRVPAPK